MTAPKSTAELQQLREKHLPRGLASAHPVFAQRAQGARLWDTDGKEYLDFAGGIGVLNIGHGHPAVLAAVEEQLRRFTHTSAQVVMYEGYVELARRLSEMVPTGAENKALLLTSGAEAVENAVKIARSYTGRPAVVAFRHAFHGRTLLGMTLTGKANPYRQNFGPFAPEVYHSQFPYPYRGVTTEDALQALQELFETEVTPDRVAAVIIEPVVGEGGFLPAPPEFLRALRMVCDEHGIVLIADEIQTGFGRTGRMFAVEHAGVQPDLMTVAKSMGAGLPISAVVGRAPIMDAPAPGGLGGTYGGNPLACAAALAVIELMDGEFLDRAAALGERMRAHLDDLRERYSPFGEVRGLGPMAALELVEDERGTPATALTAAVMAAAREEGVILLSAGGYRNVLRVLVPLVVSESEFDEGAARIGRAFERVEQSAVGS